MYNQTLPSEAVPRVPVSSGVSRSPCHRGPGHPTAFRSQNNASSVGPSLYLASPSQGWDPSTLGVSPALGGCRAARRFKGAGAGEPGRTDLAAGPSLV